MAQSTNMNTVYRIIHIPSGEHLWSNLDHEIMSFDSLEDAQKALDATIVIHNNFSITGKNDPWFHEEFDIYGCVPINFVQVDLVLDSAHA